MLSAIAAAAFLVGSCVGARSEKDLGEPVTAPEHVHGIGATDNGSVYLATHAGLFRAAVETFRLTRVGTDRRHLTGFSAVDDRRFIASGHPQLAAHGEPSQLGIIASADEGHSWSPVALTGRADLHVLRASGDRLYGYDDATNRLLMSPDGGRTWQSRGASAQIFDLAIDPTDADALVATTARGAYESRDAGRTWRLRSRERTGLLIWPPRSGPMLIDARGRVFARNARRRAWEQVGDAGLAPAAVAVDNGLVFLATRKGRVLQSIDAGRSWELRATAPIPR